MLHSDCRIRGWQFIFDSNCAKSPTSPSVQHPALNLQHVFWIWLTRTGQQDHLSGTTNQGLNVLRRD